MIISVEKDFLTAKEKARVKELEGRLNANRAKLVDFYKAITDLIATTQNNAQQIDSAELAARQVEIETLSETFEELRKEYKKITDAADKRYIAQLSPTQAYEDAVKILSALTREDFEQHIAFMNEYATQERREKPTAEYAYQYAHLVLALQIRYLDDLALHNFKHGDQTARTLLNQLYCDIAAKVETELGVETSKEDVAAGKAILYRDSKEHDVAVQLSMFDDPFTATLYADITESVMLASPKRRTGDPFSTMLEIPTKRGTVTIKNTDQIKGELSVPVKKLLYAACAQFAAQSTYRSNSFNPTVMIPFTDYARANGIHVDPVLYEDPAEIAAENSRIKAARSSFKKSLQQAIECVSNVYSTFDTGSESGVVRIISSGSVNTRQDYIKINLDPDAARYLTQHGYIAETPISAMLAIDNHNSNAWAILEQMVTHYNQDGNYRRDTYNTLSVATLLTYAPDIQSYEELQAKGRKDWRVQISQRLENALDEGLAAGVLSDWHYVVSIPSEYRRKHKPVERAAAAALSWTDYSALMIEYSVKDFPEAERAERIDRKQAEYEKKKAEAEKKAAAAKKRNSRKPKQ